EPGYRRPIGPLDTHGTHVMDLAGGRPIDTVETAARPLVAVEVPPLATLDTSGGHLASYVLQAVHRILHWADTWPDPRGNGAVRVSVVINFSYGISAGPKNGQGFLEREIARLVDARNAEGLTTKVVVPAGNNYRDQLTGGVTVPFGETAAFDWCVIPADQSVSFLELRAPQGSPFTLTLTPPDGASVTVAVPAAGGASVHEWTKDGTTLGAIYVQPAPATSGMVLVTVALGPTIAFDGRARTPAGAYRIAVANTAPGPDEIALTLWVDVQRDDTPSGYPIYGRQSYLDDQGVAAVDPVLKSWDAPGPASAVQRAGTMSAFATSASDHIFAVGGAYPDDNSYDNDDPDLREPTWYTSAGPTRDPGARDPALAAISEEGRGLYGVLAAGTYSGSVSAVSGTSAAAPQVTRGIVDILTANPAASRADILQGLLGQGMFPAPDPRLGAGVLPDPPKAEQRPLRRRYP
ncbi:MAG: S8 family serine peptidase, partial [Rhodobacter sp.]|nr:S8 family serine peptidase [Rhodobacter sp.]